MKTEFDSSDEAMIRLAICMARDTFRDYVLEWKKAGESKKMPLAIAEGMAFQLESQASQCEQIIELIDDRGLTKM